MRNFEDVVEDQLENQQKIYKNDREHPFVKIWRGQDFVHQAHPDVAVTVDIEV